MRQGRLRVTTVVIGAVLILLGAVLFFASSVGGRDSTGPTWALLAIAGSMAALGALLVCLAAFPTSRTRDPIRRVQKLATNLPPAEALAQVADLVAQQGGIATRSDKTHLDASFGSQLALRLTGISTQFGTDRLPYHLEVDSFQAAGQTQLELSFRSNEGRYLTRGRSLEHAYDRRFTYFVAVLESKVDGS
jgi:hypothetical protein